MYEFVSNPALLLIGFGLLSGLLSTFAYLPYIRDTAAGHTQPQRASWFIWSVLGSIAFLSQLYEGAGSSLWFAGVQVSGTIIVFLLSIRFGIGGLVKRSDCIVLAFAGAGLLIWYFTQNAVYALAITIGISLLGGGVTVAKAHAAPESETLSTWFMSFIASGCAILSVGALDWVFLAYPIYLFVLNGAIVLAILLGRMREAGADVLILTPARRAPLRSPVLPAHRLPSLLGIHRRGSIGRWHPPIAG